MTRYTYERTGLQWTVYRVHDDVRGPIASMLSQGAAMSVVRELESVRERAEKAETQVARMQHYLDIHLGRLRSLAAQYDPGKHGDCYDPVDALSDSLVKLRAAVDAAERYRSLATSHNPRRQDRYWGLLCAALDACRHLPTEQPAPSSEPAPAASSGLSPALRAALLVLLEAATDLQKPGGYKALCILRAAISELRDGPLVGDLPGSANRLIEAE